MSDVADFIRQHVIPAEAALDAGGPDAAGAMRDLQGKAQAGGLWALPLPSDLGGGGLGCASISPWQRWKAAATMARRRWDLPACWTCG